MLVVLLLILLLIDAVTEDEQEIVFKEPASQRARKTWTAWHKCGTCLIFHLSQMAEFLHEKDILYNKKRADHTLADRKNKAREELVGRMDVEVKVLRTFFNSIKTDWPAAVDKE